MSKRLRTMSVVVKKGFPLIVSILATGFVSGCASTKAYFVDRGRDAGDIVSVAVGTGLGAKLRVSSISLGLLAHEGSVAGLNAGCLFAGPPGKYCNDLQFFCCGNQLVEPPGSKERLKKFRARQFDGFLGMSGEDDEGTWCLLPPFIFTPMIPFRQKVNEKAPYYYTHIEAVVAAGVSLRVGFNPGELVDFVLGCVGIDIMGDDLDRKRIREAALPKTPPSP